MLKLSFNARRIIVGMMGLPCGLALANDLGKFHWFWPYDRQAFAIALLLGIASLFFFPSMAEIKAYREKKDREALKKMEAHLNGESRESRSE